jgi:acyl-coenzyme A synthetase/AMP-(fatty) acid ligase
VSRPDNAGWWLLDRHVEGGAGSAPCFRDAAGTVPYAGVLDRAAAAGGLLAAAGVRPGDRVLVALPDGVTAAAVLLGAVRAGAVAVPVSPRLGLRDAAKVAADAEPAAAVVAPGLEELAAAVGPSTGDRCWRAGGPAPGWRDLDAELDRAPAAAAAAVTGDAPALIQYTSGSTGEPRGVVHRHRALRTATAGMVGRLDLRPADVLFSASKLAFGYGFGNSLLLPLAVGASSVLLDRPVEPAAVARVLARHRPSVVFAVPTLYATLLAAGDAATRFPLREARAYVSSGEHLSAGLAARCAAAFGPRLLDVFGCTETLYSFAGNRLGQWRPDRVGEPFPGYRLRLEPGGDTGELYVRGPGVAAGYWRRPAATAAAFRDGWVRTGDQLQRTPDGGLRHLGRTDDVLKVGGLKVAPAEIEDVLLADPAVTACAAVGVPDGDGLTRVVAYVTATDPGCAPRLRALLRDRLPAPRRPAAVELVAELPRTATGKTSRHLLRLAAGTDPRTVMR